MFNPWRAVGRAVGGGFERIAGQRFAHARYPEWLGRWPAAVGLMAVVWLEIIYGVSGGVTVGLAPHAAGVAILVYSAYTLAMMAVFGTEEWCDRGEVFSVYFGMFSRLGPVGAKDGRLGLRRPFSATTSWATLPGSAAVVIASIATTSFDGGQEGVFKSAHRKPLRMAGRRRARKDRRRCASPTRSSSCSRFLGVGAVYLIGVRGMAGVQGRAAA